MTNLIQAFIALNKKIGKLIFPQPLHNQNVIRLSTFQYEICDNRDKIDSYKAYKL